MVWPKGKQSLDMLISGFVVIRRNFGLNSLTLQMPKIKQKIIIMLWFMKKEYFDFTLCRRSQILIGPLWLLFLIERGGVELTCIKNELYLVGTNTQWSSSGTICQGNFSGLRMQQAEGIFCNISKRIILQTKFWKIVPEVSFLSVEMFENWSNL